MSWNQRAEKDGRCNRETKLKSKVARQRKQEPTPQPVAGVCSPLGPEVNF